MTDPFSITTGVIGLVMQSIKTFQTIQGYANQYQIADLSIASTIAECSAMKFSLVQIQELLIVNNIKTGKGVEDSRIAYALDEYEGVLSACSTAFSLLNERLSVLTARKYNIFNETSFRSKIKSVWDKDEIDVLMRNIRGQSGAIKLLLLAFQAGSSAKTYQLLRERKNHQILAAVSEDARTLLAKSHMAKSIAEKDQFEDSESIIGDKIFDFDNDLTNSGVYRRHLYSYYIKSRQSSSGKGEMLTDRETDATITPDLHATESLVFHGEEYFEGYCHRLCEKVENWINEFSEASAIDSCRLTSDGLSKKVIDRLDDAILDGSDVDIYLADRTERKTILISVVIAMIWEYIFGCYFFGLDRGQGQTLKSIEKGLAASGLPSMLALWRAITLTLYAKKPGFTQRQNEDIVAVTYEIFSTLAEILSPPPSQDTQLRAALQEVVKSAADLSVELRTQRAEYIVLPPLRAAYDRENRTPTMVRFNATLMNERSGEKSFNAEFEEQNAALKVLLFPLVIKRGDDFGAGDKVTEVVIFPAQVLVNKSVKDLPTQS